MAHGPSSSAAKLRCLLAPGQFQTSSLANITFPRHNPGFRFEDIAARLSETLNQPRRGANMQTRAHRSDSARGYLGRRQLAYLAPRLPGSAPVYNVRVCGN